MKSLKLGIIFICLNFAVMPRCLADDECNSQIDYCEELDSPLDDGVIFLIAAGAIFAVREHRKRTAAIALTDIN